MDRGSSEVGYYGFILPARQRNYSVPSLLSRQASLGRLLLSLYSAAPFSTSQLCTYLFGFNPSSLLEGNLYILPTVTFRRFPLHRARLFPLKSPSYRVTLLPWGIFTLSLEMHSQLERHILSFSPTEMTLFHNSQCFPRGLQPSYQDYLIIMFSVSFHLGQHIKVKSQFSHPRENSFI